ncbi:glucose-6-phosphate dehydrogenase [Microbacterium sp. C7(2022)]|uniref:glucose-6-phosphate dehydrogenase n=1 Tax=Microbacterium sp. C7(2022) TaxID=2992759 RepID=UPI00237C1AF0|nr:glucose-6-phosphate dehydrogenase [Microbacterium sp. C7(2022)]MDE0546160.1 glucose-6-phosphate dehydrogenase [Microbacterium sp. C7(2022)]
MKITSSSDWRDAMAFEIPVPAVDVLPGEPTRCVGCGPDAAPHPREELWAVKHKHPNNHSGYVRLYCSAHAPKPERRVVEPNRRSNGARRTAERLASPRRDVAVERPRELCPNCFVEIPPAGTCGMCGYEVG